MKKFLAAACAVAMVVAGAAYGAAERSGDLSIEKQAALYQIGKIEKTWHRAASTKNVDLMMTLWAPNATFTIAGQTYTGKKAIRHVFAKAAPFQPQNHWESDTPAYKIRITVNGNRGTLYFECHYVDVDTGKVAAAVGADQDVRKINGRWKITKSIAASATLKQ